ncbi:MAG: hypothetical protein IID31_11915 [Planctomycetes bacterium]|nr:hypothetical protein [Planctomycetota bacterium]
MNHTFYKAKRSRVRTAFVLVGAAVIAISATPRSASAQVTQQWHAREFQDRVFGVDDAVDIAYWKDESKNPPKEWVYMTGYQTTSTGATVFATYKYDPNDPGPIATSVADITYPEIAGQATGTNRAVAIAIDPETGDVYVTGESIDPTGADGLDYVTIKYDKDLVPDEDWEAAGHPGAVVRWDNPIFAGPGSHDRPVDIALGKRFAEFGAPQNVIGITGRSNGGPATKYDIVTVLMNAVTGNPWSDWGDVGLGVGARSFNGDADGNDSAAGLDLYWSGGIEGEAGLYTIVAGTTRYLHSGQPNDDIVTIQYDPDGNRTGSGWTNVYDGPMIGDDVATAMVVNLKRGGVFVCGYTPHYVAGASASSGGGSGTGAASGGGGLRR